MYQVSGSQNMEQNPFQNPINLFQIFSIQI